VRPDGGRGAHSRHGVPLFDISPLDSAATSAGALLRLIAAAAASYVAARQTTSVDPIDALRAESSVGRRPRTLSNRGWPLALAAYPASNRRTRRAMDNCPPFAVLSSVTENINEQAT
jgi:hypothetical protein